MANNPKSQRIKRIGSTAGKIETPYRAIDDVDQERLKLLAAIMIEFNAAEAHLDSCLMLIVQADPDLEPAITSRINGLEGKVEIIKQGCRTSPTLSGYPAEAISDALTNFMTCKSYRDALVHARFHNETDEILLTSAKHGKF